MIVLSGIFQLDQDLVPSFIKVHNFLIHSQMGLNLCSQYFLNMPFVRRRSCVRAFSVKMCDIL